MSDDGQQPKPPALPKLKIEERDRRKVKTPPKGVLAQLAPPSPAESWDDQHTPVETVPRSVETPVEAIDRRVKETNNAALTTIDRVEILRRETREDIRAVHDKIASTDEKVDAVVKVVGDLRVEVGGQGVQNKTIIGMLEEQKQFREREEHVKKTMRLAEIEVDTSRQLTDLELSKKAGEAKIEEAKAAAALRRELIKAFVLKAIAGIGVVWAVISAVYMSRCA